MTKLLDRLRAQRGRYLWGVTLGEGALLSWQVGEPHLHVEMSRAPAGLDRRLVGPRGRWQVAILDGHLTLETPAGTLELGGDEELPTPDDEALRHLEGQALVRCRLGEGLTLTFDLETELRVRGPHALVRAVGPEGEAQWMG